MILFPCDSLDPFDVERDYRFEFEAAQKAGFLIALFDFDGLRRGDAIESVLRRVPVSEIPRSLVYRGWMLSASDYTRLFGGLKGRGWNMVNDAQMYRFGHHAPENYEFWREWMPQTKWIKREEFEHNGAVEFARIFQMLRGFGSSPIIVKDWVKSQKHRWNEACFIPDASDEAQVRRVIGCFLELQGEQLTGGLVFRRFENLRGDAANRSFEWRSFWLDGEMLSLSPNLYGDEVPAVERFAEHAKKCPSRFWTLDLAQRENGEWIVIEMGDGGVSGLPVGSDLPVGQDRLEWYRALARHAAL